jgi:hypothetical protein
MPNATVIIEDGETEEHYAVDVEYREIAESYGADADGRRGTVLTTIEVGEAYAPEGTPASVIKEAMRRVERGERR